MLFLFLVDPHYTACGPNSGSIYRLYKFWADLQVIQSSSKPTFCPFAWICFLHWLCDDAYKFAMLTDNIFWEFFPAGRPKRTCGQVILEYDTRKSESSFLCTCNEIFWKNSGGFYVIGKSSVTSNLCKAVIIVWSLDLGLSTPYCWPTI